MTTQRKLLLGVLAVLVALIGLDRFVLTADAGDGGGGGGSASDGTSLKEIYRARAALLDRQRALIEQRSEWERANVRAIDEWRALAGRLIVAQSVEIAEGELRERLEALASEMGLPRPDARALPPIVPDEASPVRVIRYNLLLSTAEWESAFALIDRIETDPSTIARVTEVTIDGPGLPQIETELSLTLTVQAIAIIEAPRKKDAS